MKRLLLTALALCYGCVSPVAHRQNYSPDYINRPKANQLEYKIPRETLEEYLKKVPKLPLPVDKEFEERLFKKQPRRQLEQKKQREEERPTVVSIEPLYAQF